MMKTVNVKITLEGLENLLETATAMETAAKNQEVFEGEVGLSKVDKFRKIVEGVAKKYQSKWVSREDLEQELWIKVLTMIEDCGGDESNLDENLVAKACFRKAIDYYRYCRRRYEANVALFTEDDKTELEGDLEYDPSKLLKTHGIIDQGTYTMVNEVLGLFEEGTKEYRYIVAKLYSHGLLDEEVYGRSFELPEKPKAPRNVDDEIDYCAMLGYNSKKISGSWINKKRQMRVVIEEYLGR